MTASRHPQAIHPLRRATALAVLATVGGCAAFGTNEGSARKETVHAVTASGRLVSFNAGQPGKLLSQVALSGLEQGDAVAGIDYRVARGKLFLLTTGGRLYQVEPASGKASRIGAGAPPVTLGGKEFGVDFNPTVDRIRVVTDSGLNLRLHPDTGAMVDGDPNTPGVQGDGRLAYAAGDVAAGRTPKLVAAGYTYNKQDEKLTTNFALDAAGGTLVTQGTREGVTPAVSPNSGTLFTVGRLGVPPFERASFDIADLSGAAYAAIDSAGSSAWYEIDLASGKAVLLGRIGGGEPVLGIAIEP